jgi:membrane-bound lytic murein transglycosylase A
MGTPLRNFLWSIFAAAMIAFAATECGHARRLTPFVPNRVAPAAALREPSSAEVDSAAGPFKVPNAELQPAEWNNLDGWPSDDHASAFATFYASCRTIVRASAFRAEALRRGRPIFPEFRAPSGDTRPVRTALEPVCARAVKAGRLASADARQFFETNFVPVRIRRLGDPDGFLTGYYEPIVEGSRFPTREFTVPIYRRPRDLVAPGVRDGGPFPNSGRAFRRTATGELVPYYDRGQIENGALDGQHLEICWLRSTADALAIDIEGSARIRLEDGTFVHVGYDAHNGYPFVPIGRALVERRLMSRPEASTQHVNEWMHNNPELAKDVRRQNRQVVFFRIVGLDDDTEAIGAQGIPLSAGRSIAVDKALHVYGTPFFIEADVPPAGSRREWALRRVMIAQDTGSAIVGPARADLYVGAGEEAGQLANRIRQNGRVTMLLPRELDPLAAGARMPLPPEKPLPQAHQPPPGKPMPQVQTASPAKPPPQVQSPATVTPMTQAQSPPAKPVPSQAATRTSQPAMRVAVPDDRRRLRYYNYNYYYYYMR